MSYVNGAVQAAATVYKGYQESANYETAAKNYEVNAATAARQGAAEEDRMRFGDELKLGVQRAAIAESGFSADSASLDTLQSQSKGQLELDALTSRYKTQIDVLDWTNRRDVANRAGRTARHNANVNKVSAFISGTFGGGGGFGGKDTAEPTDSGGQRAKTSEEVNALYSDYGYTGTNGYGG